MTVIEKINQIWSIPSKDDRLKAELRFLAAVSQNHGGEYDALLQTACDVVLQENYISESVTLQVENMLESLAAVAKSYKLHCIAHAHIDMNWQWAQQETVTVTLDTFRTMLQLMEEYPDFIFCQSQASTYAICEEYDPDLFAEIQQRVAEGRWVITASTWTEGDKNLPSGESLCRHYLYTKQYMREKFGLSDDQMCLCFEPDTFGHNVNMPMILSKAGVKYYYHCRGEEQMDAYRYRAPSGDEVLCYQDPYFYNGAVDPGYLEILPYLEKARGVRVGMRCFGVGDHGGGPSRRDIKRIKEMQTWPLAPQIVFSHYRAFFDELAENYQNLPVADTERNFIFTGCYSSQSHIKGGNRLCEDRLYDAETLSGLASVYADAEGYTDGYAKGWKKVLYNQFHDILPGSCMQDGRNFAMGEYQQALGYSAAGTSKALVALSGQIHSAELGSQTPEEDVALGAGVGFGSDLASRGVHTTAEYGSGVHRVIHLFNTTGFSRTEPVDIVLWDWTGSPERMTVTDDAGRPLTFHQSPLPGYWAHQQIQVTAFLQIPAFGYATVVIDQTPPVALPQMQRIIGSLNDRVEAFRENVLENDLVKAVFDSDMCLVSLTDKKTGTELVGDGGGYFEYFVENGAIHMPNAWSEGPALYRRNMNREGRVFVTDRDGNTPVRQQIHYRLEFLESKMEVVAYLDKDSTMVQFKVTTDWHQDGHHGGEIPTLRFRLSTAYHADSYWYDIPMGTIQRAPANHDCPGRTFVYAVPGKKAPGVALLCDTQGAYRGFGDGMSLTLLRASSIPDTYPEYGMHYHRFGVGVSGACKEHLFKMGAVLTHPILTASVKPHGGKLPAAGQLLSVDGSIMVSGIKAAENGEGLILRFYDISGADQKVNISAMMPIQKAWITDLYEQPIDELKSGSKGITAELKANTFLTVKILLG